MGILKNFILLFLLALFASQCGEAAEVNCTFDFGNESLTFETEKTRNFKKILDLGPVKSKIFVKDLNNFSELDDYMTMENDRGHKITYALSCSK